MPLIGFKQCIKNLADVPMCVVFQETGHVFPRTCLFLCVSWEEARRRASVWSCCLGSSSWIRGCDFLGFERCHIRGEAWTPKHWILSQLCYADLSSCVSFLLHVYCWSAFLLRLLYLAPLSHSVILMTLQSYKQKKTRFRAGSRPFVLDSRSPCFPMCYCVFIYKVGCTGGGRLNLMEFQ